MIDRKKNKNKIPEIDLLDMKTFNFLFYLNMMVIVSFSLVDCKRKKRNRLFFLNFLSLLFFYSVATTVNHRLPY